MGRHGAGARRARGFEESKRGDGNPRIRLEPRAGLCRGLFGARTKNRMWVDTLQIGTSQNRGSLKWLVSFDSPLTCPKGGPPFENPPNGTLEAKHHPSYGERLLKKSLRMVYVFRGSPWTQTQHGVKSHNRESSLVHRGGQLGGGVRPPSGGFSHCRRQLLAPAAKRGKAFDTLLEFFFLEWGHPFRLVV